MAPHDPARADCGTCGRSGIRLQSTGRLLDYHWRTACDPDSGVCPGWGKPPAAGPDPGPADSLDGIFAPYGYAIGDDASGGLTDWDAATFTGSADDPDNLPRSYPGAVPDL